MNEKTEKKWTDQQNIYIDWLSSPKSIREPKTQLDLGDKLGVGQTTLFNWRNLPGFKEERLKRIFAYFIPYTPDIIAALRDRAKEGNVPAINTWLEFVEQIAKQLDVTLNPQDRISDILERLDEKDTEPPKDS